PVAGRGVRSGAARVLARTPGRWRGVPVPHAPQRRGRRSCFPAAGSRGGTPRPPDRQRTAAPPPLPPLAPCISPQGSIPGIGSYRTPRPVARAAPDLQAQPRLLQPPQLVAGLRGFLELEVAGVLVHLLFQRLHRRG